MLSVHSAVNHCWKHRLQFIRLFSNGPPKGITNQPKEAETVDLSKIPVPKVVATPRPFPNLDYPQISLESLSKEPSFHALSSVTESFLSKFHYPMDMEGFLKLVNGKPHFLLRKSTQNFIENLCTQKNNESNVHLLDGINGSGKSVMLMHIVSLMQQMQDWLVIYIPNSFYWVGGYFHYNVSARNPELFDQLELAVHFLTSVLALNEEKIRNFPPLSQPVFGCSTLEELLKFSMEPDNLKHSIDIVEQVFQLLAAQDSFSVLLAVDQVNAFFCEETEYFNQESRRLRPDEFSLLRIFLDLFTGRTALKGAILGAKCHKVQFLKSVSTEDLQEKMPKANFHESFPLEIGETLSILEHYKKLGALYQPIEGNYLKKKHFMSGGIPENLFSCILYDNIH